MFEKNKQGPAVAHQTEGVSLNELWVETHCSKAKSAQNREHFLHGVK